MKKPLSELINPSAKQKEFLKTVLSHKYVLYGGAKGGGKSYILRWALIYLLIKWAKQGHENVRVALFCEDYPSLKDRQLSKIRTEFPDWLGKVTGAGSKDGLGFKLKPQYGGGMIMLRNLDDPSKYASSEFAAAAVDELTKNKKDVFDQLRGIIRWPGFDDCKFMAGTNPGEVGHAWVKSLWIDEDYEDEPEPEEFAYVHAKAKDNPYLSDAYIRSLEGLPEKLRKAYLEGSWEVFEGQFFTEWRDSVHMCKPFEIPEDWPRWRAIDYGRIAPFVCLWFTKDPETEKYYCYREYKRERTQADINFEKVASLSEGEEYIWTVLDSACWASTKKASFNKGKGDTIADEAYKAGIRARPSPKDRMAGWNFVSQFLRWNEMDKETGMFNKVEPDLRFFKSECDYMQKTMPSLVHDDNKPEDLDTDGPDHGADALSYFLQKLNKDEEDDEDNPFEDQKDDKQQLNGNLSSRISNIVNGEETNSRRRDRSDQDLASKTFL